VYLHGFKHGSHGEGLCYVYIKFHSITEHKHNLLCCVNVLLSIRQILASHVGHKQDEDL